VTAELDYAYLADYATVENGKLTAVGASFTLLQVPTLPYNRTIAIAGRIRAPESTTHVPVQLIIAAPHQEWELSLGAEIVTDGSLPYDGKIGVLFAAVAAVTLTETGLYVVNIEIDGALARTLKFAVEQV